MLKSSAWREIIRVALMAAVTGLIGACDTQAARDARRVHGARLFEEQLCVVCHGALGRGDGPRARNLDRPPRDFRDLDAYVQGTSAREIANTIAGGIHVRQSPMPTFGHLTAEDRLALGEFIVSLQQASSRR